MVYQIKYKNTFSQTNTTPQHRAAIPIILTPFHAAMTPTISAAIPASGI